MESTGNKWIFVYRLCNLGIHRFFVRRLLVSGSRQRRYEPWGSHFPDSSSVYWNLRSSIWSLRRRGIPGGSCLRGRNFGFWRRICIFERMACKYQVFGQTLRLCLVCALGARRGFYRSSLSYHRQPNLRRRFSLRFLIRRFLLALPKWRSNCQWNNKPWGQKSNSFCQRELDSKWQDYG